MKPPPAPETAADAMRALTEAATSLIQLAAKLEQSSFQRAALQRAEYMLDAAALVADKCRVEHNREALATLRRIVMQANLA